MVSLESNPFGIQVRSGNGQIETISPAVFFERYGVEYARQLHFDRLPLADFDDRSKADPLPLEWQRPALQRYFAEVLIRRNVRSLDATLKNWLYGEKVQSGYTANLYLAPVGEAVGLGVFAGSDIETGDMLGEYTGVVRHRDSGDDENPYLFNYEGQIIIDAQPRGNYTRYINHGKVHANAHYTYMWAGGTMHIVLVATKLIPKDKQVLFDYGEGYWRSIYRAEPVELE